MGDNEFFLNIVFARICHCIFARSRTLSRVLPPGNYERLLSTYLHTTATSLDFKRVQIIYICALRTSAETNAIVLSPLSGEKITADGIRYIFYEEKFVQFLTVTFRSFASRFTVLGDFRPFRSEPINITRVFAILPTYVVLHYCMARVYLIHFGLRNKTGRLVVV